MKKEKYIESCRNIIEREGACVDVACAVCPFKTDAGTLCEDVYGFVSSHNAYVKDSVKLAFAELLLKVMKNDINKCLG